jgi:hypothetical protein
MTPGVILLLGALTVAVDAGARRAGVYASTEARWPAGWRAVRREARPEAPYRAAEAVRWERVVAAGIPRATSLFVAPGGAGGADVVGGDGARARRRAGGATRRAAVVDGPRLARAVRRPRGRRGCDGRRGGGARARALRGVVCGGAGASTCCCTPSPFPAPTTAATTSRWRPSGSPRAHSSRAASRGAPCAVGASSRAIPTASRA